MNSLHDLQITALTRLFALGTVLGSAMADRLTDEGLTTARAELVWRLHHNGPMTQRQLSDALECTPRNVTGLVDALEESGFVERRPHPTDRRATHVVLTNRGAEAAGTWSAQSQAFAQRIFEYFSPEDLDSFVEMVERVLARIDTSIEAASNATTKPS